MINHSRLRGDELQVKKDLQKKDSLAKSLSPNFLEFQSNLVVAVVEEFTGKPD